MSGKVKAKKIKVTQTASPIGKASSQKKTLIGLGLRKMNHSTVLENTQAVQGMIFKVKHLLKVEEL